MSLRFVFALCAAALLVQDAGLAQGQDDQMNARDAFWSAADLVDKRPVKTTASRAAAPAKKSPVRIAGGSRPKTVHGATELPPETTASVPTPSAPAQQPSIVRVSDNAPLGLRYTLLKKTASGKYQEVLPETPFHAGDTVKVSVMANEPGYLYIIQQGSSGAWSSLYPQPDTVDNKLEPGKVYSVPSDGAFTFDQRAGQEKLFILLTRQPQSDLDETILALRHDQNGANTSLASSKINDAFLQQLRSDIGARDLVFTKVDGETASETKDDSAGSANEKAIYVVNKAGAKNGDSKIVVDMTLKHE